MEENAAVKTLSLLIATLALYLLIWQGAARFFALPVYYYARLIELMATLLFVALACTTPMRFSEMGIVVTRRCLFRSLLFGGLTALLAVGVLAVCRVVKGGGAPVFSLRLWGDISRATYIVVAPFQEVLAKSVLLCGFERCFGGRRPFLSNLFSALVFGAFHVVYGIRMMLLAMFLAFLTGVLFQRARCVWGCALAHFAFGFFPACFGFF